LKKDENTSINKSELSAGGRELNPTWAKDFPHIKEPNVLKLVHELQVHQIEFGNAE